MSLVLAVAVAFALLNALAFALVGLDKRRARRRHWRLSERTLLLAALASGTLGTWLGVFTFRHKTRKAAFLVPLALVTLLDLAALVAVVIVTRG